jgi:sRNA-binding protein
MTTIPTEEANEPSVAPTANAAQPEKQGRFQSVQPVLEKLFELYPKLFGAEFLPLKLGVFQELLAAHPEHFKKAELKAALGVHTRSGRYLQSVAAGKMRHDLQGNPVENVAPEHIFQTIVELFRRRQARSKEDLRPKVCKQILAAFDASGLSRQDYLALVQSTNADVNALLDQAFAERNQAAARNEALLRAFEGSGKTAAEFADMYGMDLHLVTRAIEQKHGTSQHH